MKTPIYLLLGLFLLNSCSNSQSKSNNSETGDTDISQEINSTNEELSAESIELIKAHTGEYYLLEDDAEGFVFVEPCNFKSYDIKISSVKEGSDIWELHWFGSTELILKAEMKGDDLLIRTDAAEDEDFFLSKNEQALLWNFSRIGQSDPSIIVRAGDIGNFPTIPCDMPEEIMKYLPEEWLLISKIDGAEVLYEPCMSAPGGLTIEIGDAESAGTIDFWSGSDPYEITTMIKSNGQIRIEYKSIIDESTGYIIMHDLKGDVAQFGKGEENDERYVNAEVKEIIPVLKEECE